METDGSVLKEIDLFFKLFIFEYEYIIDYVVLFLYRNKNKLLTKEYWIWRTLDKKQLLLILLSIMR